MEIKNLKLRDLYCSSWIAIFPEGKFSGTTKDDLGRILFIFDDYEKASLLANQFYSGSAIGNVSQFAEKLKSFKSMLHNMCQSYQGVENSKKRDGRN